MGFFDIFKSESEPEPDPEPYDLLRQATAAKKAGDIEGAIALLREAYALEEEDESYYIDSRLRLPMYLQIAGRNDEAWGDFNALLQRTSKLPVDQVLAIHSIINDKMKVFLLKEGKPKLAVRHAALSYLNRIKGHGMDEELPREGIEWQLSMDEIEKTFRTCLKKAGKSDKLGDICRVVKAAADKTPEFDIIKVFREVESLLRD